MIGTPEIQRHGEKLLSFLCASVSLGCNCFLCVSRTMKSDFVSLNQENALMTKTIVAFSVVAMLATGVCADEKNAIKSGPQVGQKVPGPFHPLNVNGEGAGKEK